MFDYIANMLEALPDNMKGESATPAGAHIFQINEDDPTLLEEAKAVMFHHNTAKLLFLAKRARPSHGGYAGWARISGPSRRHEHPGPHGCPSGNNRRAWAGPPT
jgi:hypothetical protein